MILAPLCSFLSWSLSLLVTRCAEPSAFVCPRPALSPFPPVRCVPARLPPVWLPLSPITGSLWLLISRRGNDWQAPPDSLESP
jgi:hypothetical protein